MKADGAPGDVRQGFVPFETVLIIGMGMMGGSLGLEMRHRALAQHVIGVDIREASLSYALERGTIDEGTTDAQEAVRKADLIVLATPVGAIVELLESIAPQVRPDALITDLGSVKSRILTVGEGLYGEQFVGGHPMCGSPLGGIEAALENLFEGSPWAVVRSHRFTFEQNSYTKRLTSLISALGAMPIALDAAQHDRAVALVSHLPHALAFTFADLVDADPEANLARGMAGGSYRDLVRVAGADRDFWNEIFEENRSSLLEAIEGFERHLKQLKYSLERK